MIEICGFIFKDYLLLSALGLVLHNIMHCDWFKFFESLIFVDDKLPAKTAMLHPLKICTHTVINSCMN